MMIVGFIVFYSLTAILLLFGYKDLFIPLVGLIFLAGALFVLFVSNTSYITLKELFNTTASKNVLEQKNSDLAQFARLISHDLKSPLRNIGSFAQILKKDCADKMDETSEEYINIIIDSSQNMYAMLEELSVHNKLKTSEEPNNLHSINLNELIDEVKFSVQQVLKEENVDLQIDKNLPNVKASEAKLKLVFQNLIDNAVKYNKNEKKSIEISAITKDKYNVIAVKDNGIGIEEKYFDKIFKIFERLHNKSEFSGTGIGLANVTDNESIWW